MEMQEVKIDLSSVPTVAARIDRDVGRASVNFHRPNHNNGNIQDNSLKFTDKSNPVMKITRRTKSCIEDNFDRIVLLGKFVLAIGYFVYFGFALAYHIGDEGSWRLVWCTCLGVWITCWGLLKRTKCYTSWSSAVDKLFAEYSKGKRSTVFRW